MIHELKTIPLYFQAIKNGSKPFEVRRNDKDFREDDILFLREYIPADYYDAGDEARYTGEILYKKVSFILYGGQFGIEAGYVVMGLKDYSVDIAQDENLFRLLNANEVIEGKTIFIKGSNGRMYSLEIVSNSNFHDENSQLTKPEAEYYQTMDELYTFK